MHQFSLTKINESLSHKIANMGFVCALLVVFLHVPRLPESQDVGYRLLLLVVRDGLSSIAIPFFFCTSGFLFVGRVDQPGWYWTAMRRRMRTLLLPYVVLNLAWFVYRRLGTLFSEGHKSLSFDWMTLIEGLGINLCAWPELGVLWYVRCLLVFALLIPVVVYILRHLGRSGTWCLVIVLLFTYFLMREWSAHSHWSDKVWLFWRYGFSMRGFCYFVMGVSLRLFGKCGVIPRSVNPKVSAFLLLAVGLILSSIDFCVGFCETLLLLGVWMLVPASAWPEALTGNMFAVYVLHVPIIVHLREILIKCGTDYMYTSVGFVGMWFVAIWLSIAAALLLKKFVPKISYFVFGGR